MERNEEGEGEGKNKYEYLMTNQDPAETHLLEKEKSMQHRHEHGKFLSLRTPVAHMRHMRPGKNLEVQRLHRRKRKA